MKNLFTYIKIIFEMIKKNFLNILRSRSSALIILVGPFLIIFLIGLAFNTTGLHNIKIGIYAEEKSAILDEIVQSLENNDFSVRYTDTEEHCINLVKNGEVHLCISINNNLGNENIERKLVFHVDYSKVNLVFSILNVITHEVEDISQDLSIEYAQLLIEQMNTTAAEIKDKSSTITELSNNAEEMRQSLELLNAQLTGMEVDSKSFGLDSVESKLSESTAMIDEFGSIAEETTSAGLELLDELDSYLGSFKSELDEQIITVEEFQNTVGSYSALACAFDFGSVEELSFNPCIELEAIEDSLNNAIIQAESVGNQFNDLQNQLDSVKSKLESALEQQQDILDAAAENINSLSGQLQTSTGRINDLNAQKKAVSGDLDTLIVTLNNNIAQIDEIQASIDEIGDNLANAEITSAEEIVNPILTQIKPILNSKSYLDYTMPALLVLVIMFMSILLSSTVVMTEKNTRAYFRNYIAPVPDTMFLISIYLTNVLIVFIQSTILLIIAQFAFGVPILSNTVSIMFALLLISSIFILIGMCIGYLFVSEETSTLASISFASICLLFSSFLIPIESLSPAVGTIAQLNPFVVSEGVLRQLIIFGNSAFSALDGIMLLIFYIIIISTFLYMAEMIDKRRLR